MQKLKLNNSGITVVELVVTFALVMIIVVGMLDIIAELKDASSEKILQRQLLEYNSTITQIIQDDLIRKKAIGVSACPNNQKQKLCYNIAFDGGVSKQLIINMVSDLETKKYISYDGIIYPLPQQSLTEFRDSAVLYNPSGNLNEINNVEIKIDSNNFLHIYIPFFVVDDETNHGIDIVYPIGL